MLGCCRLPEYFNTRPSPVRNNHSEGPQNMNKWDLTIYGKRRSLFILTSKGVKHYNIILIISIIIIAPRQLGNHPMKLELHCSAFKNLKSFYLSIHLNQRGRYQMGFGEPSTGKQFFVVVFS